MPQKTKQPQPEMKPASPEAVLATVGASRKTHNRFAMAAAAVSERTRLKSALLSDVRQKLAEIADTEVDADKLSSEASDKANSQAFRLYQARATGTISADELSGLLGDVFGYKLTSKGIPGKTPKGLGEVIRKRIVRSVAARDFSEGRDGGAFFDVLDKDDVAEIVHELNEGNLTVWGVYDKLAAMKSDATDRPHFAFDPRKIAAMIDKLNEEGAAKKIASNAALEIAYGKLIETLAILGEVPVDDVEDIEEEIAEELQQQAAA